MNTANTKVSTVAIPKELSFILFVLAVVFILWPARVEAATFNVTAGSFEGSSDSICQIEEALVNINDGARTNVDCVETGAYGTNDTVNLPAGTITGNGSGFDMYEPVKIIGQGRGVSTISTKSLGLTGGSSLTNEFTLQDFTLNGGAGITADHVERLTIDGMELESNDDYWAGLTILSSKNADIYDSYFHGKLTMSGSGVSFGIAVSIDEDVVVSNVDIERTTMDHVTRGIFMGYEGSGSGTINSTLNATIKDTTITDIGSGNVFNPSGSGLFDAAAAIVAFTVGNNQQQQGIINYTTINNTYSTSIANSNASAILEIGTEYGQINHTAQNDLYAVGNGSDAVNYRKLDLSGSGTPTTFTTTSDGGNISSDGSYGSLLNKSTDKHNVTTLASFLGVLKDNGGSVPTLALLEGSPAINAGTNVLGLTTDARGSARLQGTAIDAGAYESAFGSASNGASDKGVVPKVPNTGFYLLKNNPVVVLLTSFVSSVAIYILSRKYKSLKK